MFNRSPVNKVNGIFDFVIPFHFEDDYIKNYEEISVDIGHQVSVETSVLGNLCEMVRSNVGRILDVGCGRGYMLDRIYRFKEKVGLDISLNELKHITDPEVVKVRAFAEDMPFEDGYFNTIICFDVLEHVQHVEMLASEIDRVLDERGELFLACPWEQDLSVYESKEYKREYKQYRFKHLRSIDQQLIGRLFKDYIRIGSAMITAHERFMAIKPYPIHFMHFAKDWALKRIRSEEENHKTV